MNRNTSDRNKANPWWIIDDLLQLLVLKNDNGTVVIGLVASRVIGSDLMSRVVDESKYLLDIVLPLFDRIESDVPAQAAC